MEVKIIGQMDNTIDHTFESANRVYDKNVLSPTINTCGGGGLQPKIIIEPKCLNSKGGRGGEMGLQPSVQDRVYSTDAVSTAATTSFMPSILEEKTIVAMRGRNPDNPSDRTAGSPTEQRLEPNSQGICNTLTSVQKDNLVLEKECLGGINYKVSEDFQKGILKDCARSILSRNDGAACVERVKNKQATKDGYIECKVGGVADLSFPDSATRRGRVQDMGDTCPTLMAGESDICRIEKVGQISSSGSQCGTVISDKGLCSTLSAGTHGYANNHIQTQYRIRKLTPLECWRLMDFSDEDFHKAEKVCSNTQLYKQAGNSIVKNVLVAIFGQMILGKEKIYREL